MHISTSASLVSSSRQKAEAHTVTLSQGERLSSALLQQNPAQKCLSFPACIFCLFDYRASQWHKRQCRCPVHFPSYLLCWLLWLNPPHVWKMPKGWSTGSFGCSTRKLQEALEKPFPVPIPCTVCLLLAPNTTCSLLEELPLFISSLSQHKKPFFCECLFWRMWEESWLT